jgi:hypothetical protein
MKNKIIKLDGFEFPWRVSKIRNTKQHEYLDEAIRRCEQDEITIQKKKINFSDIEDLFKKNSSVFIFANNSQYNFYPVYCILLDIATPIEHTHLEETVLAISRKFKDTNFHELDKTKFKELLYSEENIMRIKKFGLKLRPLKSYYY